MVAENFSESFSAGRPSGQCWDVLTDVDRIAGWVSAVGAVTEHEHLSSYSAVLEDRLGPFRLKADLDIAVTALDLGKSISIRADGEDRQIGSRITVDATLSLAPSDPGCVIGIDGRYEITGRAATMGSSTIRQKAKKMLGEFVQAARRDLE